MSQTLLKIFLILNILIQLISSKHTIKLTKFEKIFYDPSVVDIKKLNMKLVNKKNILVGEVHLYRDFDDDIKVTTKTFIKKDGKYEIYPFRLADKSFCKFCSDDGEFDFEYLKILSIYALSRNKNR